MISKELITNEDYLYNKLPRVYKDFDEKGQLRRFLNALWKAGFQESLQDIDNILTITDPTSCPEKFIPYLCESYGVPYYQDIPAKFQRRLLANIVELYRRKGTKSVITFLAREISGCSSSITKNPDGTYTIALNVFGDDEAVLPEYSPKFIVQRYLPLFLPVNIQAEAVHSLGYTESFSCSIEEEELPLRVMDLYDDMLYNQVEESEYVNIHDTSLDTHEAPIGKEYSCILVGVTELNNTFHLNRINGYDIVTTQEDGEESPIYY